MLLVILVIFVIQTQQFTEPFTFILQIAINVWKPLVLSQAFYLKKLYQWVPILHEKEAWKDIESNLLFEL